MSINAIFVDLEEDIYDRHGIYALSAVLKKHGIGVGYVSATDGRKVLKALLRSRPQYVLYSTYSSFFSRYAAFDSMLKQEMKVFSIIGGPCITFNPRILEGTTIDAGCMGEGEKALAEWLTGNRGETRNIFLRGHEPPEAFDAFVDLDAMPFPDRDVIYHHDYVRRRNPTKTFVSGRGCPFSCTYCFNHRYNELFKKSGPVVRKKSVDYVLEELRQTQARYPLKLALFNDDTFILNRKWFFEFCERFPKELGIPYACNIRANLMDEDITQALAESGCVAVNWSIESGNEFFRNQVMKRNMSRGQILETARMLNKYRIKNRIGNVIGLPGESLEQVMETLELNIAARPSLALANIFVPFPGLEMTRYALENGYFSEMPEDKLPLDYFSKSVLNIPAQANDTIQRIMCLFPIFVRLPNLYFNRRLRACLLNIPKPLLRLIYETFYAFMFKSMYRIKGGFAYTVVTASRHLRNVMRSILTKS